MAQNEEILNTIEDTIPQYLLNQHYVEGGNVMQQPEIFHEFRRDVPVLRQRLSAPPPKQAPPQNTKMGRLHCPEGMDRASLEAAANHLGVSVTPAATAQKANTMIHTLYVWAPKTHVNMKMNWDGSECLLVFPAEEDMEDSRIEPESEINIISRPTSLAIAQKSVACGTATKTPFRQREVVSNSTDPGIAEQLRQESSALVVAEAEMPFVSSADHPDDDLQSDDDGAI